MEPNLIELFAGVGGFRCGFEKLRAEGIEFNTLFANQWEPGQGDKFELGANNQFAYNTYCNRFGKGSCLNLNISNVSNDIIPDHSILVGGFPCQDYSVATTAAKGIKGKKGVLWWEIYRIVKDKNTPFLLLENVDRLLKSPSSQRGRDFGVILACLNELGYNVEWRVINASEYGYVQKRRRVFIFAYRTNLNYARRFLESNTDILLSDNNQTGFFSRVFSVEHNFFKNRHNTFNLNNIYGSVINSDKRIQKISKKFKEEFYNAGVMIDGVVHTAHVIPNYNGNFEVLGNILETGKLDKKYFLTNEQVQKMKATKKAKSIPRTSKDGHKYNYSEGRMAFPENLHAPARTMVTSEGNIGRSTHVVTDHLTGRLRFLTPLEAERINGFDDNWTEGITDRQRFFCMGNALVVDLITDMGRELSRIIEEED